MGHSVEMSALGQKQTCAAQKVMSALPPKADIDCAFRMSTKGQKRTPGQFELALLFDDLVSKAE